MKEIRLASKILRTLVKDRVHYPGRLVVDTIGVVARCGVLLALYWYVASLSGGAIRGVAFPVAAWSMFFYFSFSALRLRDISRMIMQDVRTGNIEMLFSKPVSYLSYRAWWQIGSGLYSFVVITALGAVVLGCVAGFPPTMKSAIFINTIFLSLGLGIALSLVLYIIVGLLAFWMEDISPVFWMVDKAVMILGGSYLPAALFPGFMYKMALYSPFGASQFVTHAVYDTWKDQWPIQSGIQIFWIVVLSLIMIAMFGRARERVSVNGG